MNTQSAAIAARVVQRLREIREARGISLYRIAIDTDISRSGMRHMESGTVTPTLYFLLRLCAYLEVDLAEVLREAQVSVISSSAPESLRAGMRNGK